MILLHYPCVYIQRNQSQHALKILHAMFIVTVFLTAKLQNHLKPPARNECIKKMWHQYTVEYDLDIKMNEITLLAGKCLELEIILVK